ncbi:SET and MYND domain-containing protein [Sporobolomyces koalae]|uniref:SET and MYND domain-containing protein n=1 Tax=Sporobolomyces koalae TaxID=500713 RepID=UPI0031745A40
MSSEWAQLKAQRSSRRVNNAYSSPRTASSRSSPDPRVPEPSLDDPATVRNDSIGCRKQAEPIESSKAGASTSRLIDYSHPDLPDSLAVHEIPYRGRGIVTTARALPGSTLIATSPLISVLDNRNLSRRCSACFRTSDDTRDHKPLLQCSLCHTIQYCTSSCQTRDWTLHKFECKAWRTIATAAKANGRHKRDPNRLFVPDTPVRALARLLWKSQLEGNATFMKEFESLESHRDKLSPDEQTKYYDLSIAVATCVGQETLLKTCRDSAALFDLLSRFTSNSFSLTSPTDLTNIGVSISPLTALINHSCDPNAVVVFPTFPLSSSTNSRTMRVVAIRTIEPGEEVLTSYVDLGLPTKSRQVELKERYKFECRCRTCVPPVAMQGFVDPREAFECENESCTGLVPISPGGGEASCSVCKRVCEVPDLESMLDNAKNTYQEVERTQYSDLAAARINLDNLVNSLETIRPRIARATYPLSEAYSLLLSLQLDAGQFHLAIKTARSAFQGSKRIYEYGHPVRSILSTTIARLGTVATPETQQEEWDYWKDTNARREGIRQLVAAFEETKIAFGTHAGLEGGEVGRMLRGLIKDQEEGIEMATKLAHS